MRFRRFGGLDGLRAIAVALVFVYHLFPGALPGGFIGVDVFFAISGFLITSLLVREHQLRGGIRLIAFWRRRARRLLPALGLVLLVSSALALFTRGDLLVGIGKQIAGAALFVSNWVFIATGTDYFARDTPELFRNTWSLSIEEQFYVILPLLVLALMRMTGRTSRVIPLLALGVGSAVLMFQLSTAGADPTRIYFGSDTHVFGLLLGAALAVVVAPRRAHPLANAAASAVDDSAFAPPLSAARQVFLAVVAAMGLGTLLWQSFTLVEGSPASFQGGFQLATLAALATVWAITREGAAVGRALDVAPLRWIGERSYGIYLWHWPLLLIISAAFTGAAAARVLVPILTVASTIAVAALSYRYIEQPVRRFGLRRSIRLLFGAGTRTRRRRAVSFALAGVLGLTVPATVIAVVIAPERTTAAEAIARGAAVRDSARAAETPPSAGSAGSADATGSADGSDAGSATEKPAAEKKVSPPAPTGPEISAVGDSVMLASLPELDAAFPGIAVDAEVSRGMGVGVGLVDDQLARGELRRVVVVGLGTNGPVDPSDLENLHRAVGGRPLVLVNAHAERDWIPGVNTTLAEFASAHRGVVVADWTGAVTGVEGALAGDDIHPNPSGGEIYAESVRRALAELDTPSEALGFGLPRR